MASKQVRQHSFMPYYSLWLSLTLAPDFPVRFNSDWQVSTMGRGESLQRSGQDDPYRGIQGELVSIKVLSLVSQSRMAGI